MWVCVDGGCRCSCGNGGCAIVVIIADDEGEELIYYFNVL